MSAEEALEHLKRFSVFGNADGVTRHEHSDGSLYYTGWISGCLYSSHDGEHWAAVEAVWRTG